MREIIFTLLPKLGFSVLEVMEKPNILEEAEEVFITNSVINVIPVNNIGSIMYRKRLLSDQLIKILK